MGPRVFTIEEANETLEQTESLFIKIDAARDRASQIKKKMDVLEMIHGSQILKVESPDRSEYQHYLGEIAKVKEEFESTCTEIAACGGHLKSVDEGLVDFCGVIDGRLVELCWKRGEASIEFYHHIGEGFPGRKAIPAGV